MTNPDGAPQPRDIALEQETPEQAAELEAQSDPETPADPVSEGAPEPAGRAVR